MSLPRSSSTAITAALFDRLPEVVSTVSEQMFFGWAEPCDAGFVDERVRAGATSASDTWLRVEVVFRGQLDGTLLVALPRELARDLGSAMLGAEAETLTNELLDDVGGELANVICGALLTRDGSVHQYSLLPPLVSRGLRAPGSAAAPSAYFSVNDHPMIVRLDVQENRKCDD